MIQHRTSRLERSQLNNTMWFRKKVSQLKNVFFCSIEDAKIFPWSTSEETLYRLMLSSKGCLRIYINGIKVPRRTSYVCGSYKDSDTIKIRIFGVLNFRT